MQLMISALQSIKVISAIMDISVSHEFYKSYYYEYVY